MGKSKKEVLQALATEGLVEYKTANPEGGFWGPQRWAEVTPAGIEAGIHLNRFAGPDCGPGEVAPINRISRGSITLWTED
jgi:hypothetical protein